MTPETHQVEIREDNLTGAAVIGLLREHLADMHSTTPAESVHALDLDGLRDPSVTFWAAWAGTELLGCGAMKALGEGIGEIKSMRTADAHRGKGVASAILARIIREAASRGYRSLYLETGSMIEFASARSLYERHGFTYRGPFADYTEDPNSVFMTKLIGRSQQSAT